METTRFTAYMAATAASVSLCAAFLSGMAVQKVTAAEKNVTESIDQNMQRILSEESTAYEKYYAIKAEEDKARRDAFYAEQAALLEKEREADRIGTTIRVINYDDYQKLLSEKDRFLVEVSRDTCPYCMNLSYIIKDMDTHGIDVYVLNLEEYRGTGFYDEVKKQFGITYVPTLFFIEKGVVRYCLNSPLKENLASVSSAEERAEIRQQAAEKVDAFILGAIGEGELINEEPMTKPAED